MWNMRLPFFNRREKSYGTPVAVPYGKMTDLKTGSKIATTNLAVAAQRLVDDVRRRYPGEEFRCPYMRKLDWALAEYVASIGRVPGAVIWDDETTIVLFDEADIISEQALDRIRGRT